MDARPVPANLRDGARPVPVHEVPGPRPRVAHQLGRAELPDAHDGCHPGHLAERAMHKHVVARLGVALLVGLPACVNLDEDVVTGLTPGSYGTPAVFEQLVNASYEPLRSFYAQERGFTVTAFGTAPFTKGADGSFKYINDYTTQLNPTAQYVQDTWVDFYRAINTTNAAIDQAPVVVMDSALKARRVAEARFLRALYYFDLVQMYGPLTLTLHETKSATTEATRAPVDSVYDAIVADLQFAESILPAVQKDYGRAT